MPSCSKMHCKTASHSQQGQRVPRPGQAVLGVATTSDARQDIRLPRPHLGCAAAGKGEALLQLQAGQPVVHHDLPPRPMFEELECAQACCCLLVADDEVEQQVLLGGNGRKGSQEPCVPTQAPLACHSTNTHSEQGYSTSGRCRSVEWAQQHCATVGDNMRLPVPAGSPKPRLPTQHSPTRTLTSPQKCCVGTTSAPVTLLQTTGL